jgi:hypothetical protein
MLCFFDLVLRKELLQRCFGLLAAQAQRAADLFLRAGVRAHKGPDATARVSAGR